MIRHVNRLPKGAKQVRLGCDPEFEMVTRGLFSYGVRRADRCGFNSKSGSIGCDGAGAPLELRPHANERVSVLLDNIHLLMRKFYGQQRRGALSVSGNRYAIGGHIHFGCGDAGHFQSQVAVLDDFLGRLLLPLSGEARSNYGKLGQVRDKPYGFEYRTLPAAVFHNPRVLGVVLALATRLYRTQVASGFSYQVDETCLPLRSEYERFVGKENADVLFRFVARYREAQGRKQEVVLVDSGQWLDRTFVWEAGALGDQAAAEPVAKLKVVVEPERFSSDAYEVDTMARRAAGLGGMPAGGVIVRGVGGGRELRPAYLDAEKDAVVVEMHTDELEALATRYFGDPASLPADKKKWSYRREPEVGTVVKLARGSKIAGDHPRDMCGRIVQVEAAPRAGRTPKSWVVGVKWDDGTMTESGWGEVPDGKHLVPVRFVDRRLAAGRERAQKVANDLVARAAQVLPHESVSSVISRRDDIGIVSRLMSMPDMVRGRL